MRQSLHAEWTKLRTHASTFWLLLTAAILTVAVSAAAAAATRCPSGGCDDDPAKISLTGIYLGHPGTRQYSASRPGRCCTWR